MNIEIRTQRPFLNRFGPIKHMKLKQHAGSNYRSLPTARKSVAVVCVTIALMASGCTTERILNHGAVVSDDQLDLVPVGSSKDQVLLALGTPSTTGQFNNEVYYYISQTRRKRYEFQNGRIVDQKVTSVYFDGEDTVERIARYGMKDGKVFDFISRTTPTGGKDYTFLTQLLTGRASPNAPRSGTSPKAQLPGQL